MNELEKTMKTISLALTDEGWNHDLLDKSTTIRTGYRDDVCKFDVLIVGRDDPQRVVVIIRVPLVVPKTKRVSTAEAVVRANYGAPLGRFDLDMASGAMNYFIAIPLSDAVLTNEQFLAAFLGSASWCAQYFRAFARLVFADDLSPAEVIAEIEMASNVSDNACSSGKMTRHNT